MPKETRRTVWEKLPHYEGRTYDSWQCVHCGIIKLVAQGVAPGEDCDACTEPRPAMPMHDYIRGLQQALEGARAVLVDFLDTADDDSNDPEKLSTIIAEIDAVHKKKVE